MAGTTRLELATSAVCRVSLIRAVTASAGGIYLCLNYVSPLKKAEKTVFLWICAHAAMRRRKVFRLEDRSQLQASGIRSNSHMSAPKQGLSPAELIKEKLSLLKQNSAHASRREVT